MSPRMSYTYTCKNCTYIYDPKESGADDVFCSEACRTEDDERFAEACQQAAELGVDLTSIDARMRAGTVVP